MQFALKIDRVAILKYRGKWNKMAQFYKDFIDACVTNFFRADKTELFLN